MQREEAFFGSGRAEFFLAVGFAAGLSGVLKACSFSAGRLFFGLRSVCWVLGLGGLGSRFGCSSSCGLTECSFEFLVGFFSVMVVVKAAGGS